MLNCPDCKTELRVVNKFCGAMAIYSCPRCTFQHSEFTGKMNIGTLHDWALKEAQFRRLVKKAMIAEGFVTIEQQTDFMSWLIGPDFASVPYMIINISGYVSDTPDDWISRIRDRSRLSNVNGKAPVYATIRAAGQIYKSRKMAVGF